MKRFLGTALLFATFSVPALAGDTTGPPEPPPPCRENCGGNLVASPSTTSTKEQLTIAIIRAVLPLILR